MAPVPISQIDRGSVPDDYAVDKQFGFLPCAVGGLGGKLTDRRSSCDTKDTKVDPYHLPRLSINIPAADVQWEEEDEEASTPTTASTTPGPGSSTQEDSDEEEIEEANTRVKAARNVASFAKMRQRRGRQREYCSSLQFRKDIIGPKPMMVRSSLPMDAGPLPILAFPVSVPSNGERPQPYIDVDQASSWAMPPPRSPLHRSSTTEEIQEIAAAFASNDLVVPGRPCDEKRFKRMSW